MPVKHIEESKGWVSCGPDLYWRDSSLLTVSECFVQYNSDTYVVTVRPKASMEDAAAFRTNSAWLDNRWQHSMDV